MNEFHHDSEVCDLPVKKNFLKKSIFSTPALINQFVGQKFIFNMACALVESHLFSIEPSLTKFTHGRPGVYNMTRAVSV